jgi:hypothetical protein
MSNRNMIHLLPNQDSESADVRDRIGCAHAKYLRFRAAGIATGSSGERVWVPNFSGHFLPSREGLNIRFVILSVGHALLLP